MGAVPEIAVKEIIMAQIGTFTRGEDAQRHYPHPVAQRQSPLRSQRAITEPLRDMAGLRLSQSRTVPGS